MTKKKRKAAQCGPRVTALGDEPVAKKRRIENDNSQEISQPERPSAKVSSGATSSSSLSQPPKNTLPDCNTKDTDSATGDRVADRARAEAVCSAAVSRKQNQNTTSLIALDLSSGDLTGDLVNLNSAQAGWNERILKSHGWIITSARSGCVLFEGSSLDAAASMLFQEWCVAWIKISPVIYLAVRLSSLRGTLRCRVDAVSLLDHGRDGDGKFGASARISELQHNQSACLQFSRNGCGVRMCAEVLRRLRRVPEMWNRATREERVLEQLIQSATNGFNATSRDGAAVCSWPAFHEIGDFRVWLLKKEIVTLDNGTLRSLSFDNLICLPALLGKVCKGGSLEPGDASRWTLRNHRDFASVGSLDDAHSSSAGSATSTSSAPPEQPGSSGKVDSIGVRRTDFTEARSPRGHDDPDAGDTDFPPDDGAADFFDDVVLWNCNSENNLQKILGKLASDEPLFFIAIEVHKELSAKFAVLAPAGSRFTYICIAASSRASTMGTSAAGMNRVYVRSDALENVSASELFQRRLKQVARCSLVSFDPTEKFSAAGVSEFMADLLAVRIGKVVLIAPYLLPQNTKRRAAAAAGAERIRAQFSDWAKKVEELRKECEITIVAGDFNFHIINGRNSEAGAFGDIRRLILDTLHKWAPVIAEPPEPTFRRGASRSKIDFIMSSHSAVTATSWVDRSALEEHAAVTGTIQTSRDLRALALDNSESGSSESGTRFLKSSWMLGDFDIFKMSDDLVNSVSTIPGSEWIWPRNFPALVIPRDSITELKEFARNVFAAASERMWSGMTWIRWPEWLVSELLFAKGPGVDSKLFRIRKRGCNNSNVTESQLGCAQKFQDMEATENCGSGKKATLWSNLSFAGQLFSGAKRGAPCGRLADFNFGSYKQIYNDPEQVAKALLAQNLLLPASFKKAVGITASDKPEGRSLGRFLRDISARARSLSAPAFSLADMRKWISRCSDSVQGTAGVRFVIWKAFAEVAPEKMKRGLDEFFAHVIQHPVDSLYNLFVSGQGVGRKPWFDKNEVKGSWTGVTATMLWKVAPDKVRLVVSACATVLLPSVILYHLVMRDIMVGDIIGPWSTGCIPGISCVIGAIIWGETPHPTAENKVRVTVSLDFANFFHGFSAHQLVLTIADARSHPAFALFVQGLQGPGRDVFLQNGSVQVGIKGHQGSLMGSREALLAGVVLPAAAFKMLRQCLDAATDGSGELTSDGVERAGVMMTNFLNSMQPDDQRCESWCPHEWYVQGDQVFLNDPDEVDVVNLDGVHGRKGKSCGVFLTVDDSLIFFTADVTRWQLVDRLFELVIEPLYRSLAIKRGMLTSMGKFQASCSGSCAASVRIAKEKLRDIKVLGYNPAVVDALKFSGVLLDSSGVADGLSGIVKACRRAPFLFWTAISNNADLAERHALLNACLFGSVNFYAAADSSICCSAEVDGTKPGDAKEKLARIALNCLGLNGELLKKLSRNGSFAEFAFSKSTGLPDPFGNAKRVRRNQTLAWVAANIRQDPSLWEFLGESRPGKLAVLASRRRLQARHLRNLIDKPVSSSAWKTDAFEGVLQIRCGVDGWRCHELGWGADRVSGSEELEDDVWGCLPSRLVELQGAAWAFVNAANRVLLRHKDIALPGPVGKVVAFGLAGLWESNFLDDCMVQNLAWKKVAQLQQIGVETVFSSQVACEEEDVSVYADKYTIDVVDPWNWWEGGSDLRDSSAPWLTAEGWHALPDCAPCTKEVLMDVIAGDQHVHKCKCGRTLTRDHLAQFGCGPTAQVGKTCLRDLQCIIATRLAC
mmetsp:Transcript_27059/g.68195  ORF Transcript_27059/g.68195 Transcript_27059/m.68195 type:complete len:1780 (-) Transcript_27059:2295-7634(-)